MFDPVSRIPNRQYEESFLVYYTIPFVIAFVLLIFEMVQVKHQGMAYSKAVLHYLLLTYNIIAVVIFILYNFERIDRHDDKCLPQLALDGSDLETCYAANFDDAKCMEGFWSRPSLDCMFND